MEKALRHANELMLAHPILGEPKTGHANLDQKNHQANTPNCKKKNIHVFVASSNKLPYTIS